MNYSGRALKSYFNVNNIFPYILFLYKSFCIFKNPILFLLCYLFYFKIPYLRLRNGFTLYLSSHPHDCATVFAVFVREDYGKIKKGSHVLDIGGNIGIFAIYSLISGAKHVYSIEPNSASIELIKKNIIKNGFEKKATILKNAVAAKSNIEFNIPKVSSMYNKVSSNLSNIDINQYEKINSISLKDLYKNYPLIDFTKIDCEGSEYDILLNTEESILYKPRSYVIEFHNGNTNLLIEKLVSAGYEPYSSDVLNSINQEIGILNFTKQINF